MSATNVRPVPDDFATQAHIDAETYERMYRHSIEHPDEFWAKEAELFLDWETRWNEVCDYDFNTGEASWFSGGKLNVTVNCIDRHLAERGDKVALIWEGDHPLESTEITYNELSE